MLFLSELSFLLRQFGLVEAPLVCPASVHSLTVLSIVLPHDAVIQIVQLSIP